MTTPERSSNEEPQTGPQTESTFTPKWNSRGRLYIGTLKDDKVIRVTGHVIHKPPTMKGQLVTRTDELDENVAFKYVKLDDELHDELKRRAPGVKPDPWKKGARETALFLLRKGTMELIESITPGLEAHESSNGVNEVTGSTRRKATDRRDDAPEPKRPRIEEDNTWSTYELEGDNTESTNEPVNSIEPSAILGIMHGEIWRNKKRLFAVERERERTTAELKAKGVEHLTGGSYLVGLSEETLIEREAFLLEKEKNDAAARKSSFRDYFED